MDTTTRRRLLWLTIFVIAMAQLEATVVVYLRELFYPEGFDFPLKIIRGRIAWIEVGREVSTVVMLVAIAKIAAPRDAWRQFAAFLWSFGLWDILYYVWLWAMLGWPESLLTWDVLFLIPLPWIGPCLAPMLIAAIMMASALVIESLRDRERTIRVNRLEWGLTIGGALALITIFVLDAPAVIEGSAPRPFPWVLFLAVLAAPTGAAAAAWRRSEKSTSRFADETPRTREHDG